LVKDTPKFDANKLKELLVNANKLELTSDSNIFKRNLIIYSIRDDGYESKKPNIHYGQAKWKNITKTEAEELINFLNRNITPEVAENSVDEDKLYINLINLLFDTFNENQFKKAMKNEVTEHIPYLNELQLQEVINNQVRLCEIKFKKLEIVRLTSTICLKLDGIDEIVFLETENLTVKIRKWDKIQRSVFATKYAYVGNWYFNNNKSPLELETFIEIEHTFPKDKYDGINDNDLKQYLFSIIDLIKWSIMVASKYPYPITEGTTIIQSTSFDQLNTINRDNNLCTIFVSKIGLKLDSNIAKETKRVFLDYLNIKNVFNDLDYALRFFGKACNDEFNRDKLIDAVTGLEVILLPETEQLGYQFRLHGATILYTQWNKSKLSSWENKDELFWKEENLVNWFKKLYKERSNSVHGSTYEYTEIDVVPALYALAVIISGVIYLHNKKCLNTESSKISEAVGMYVRNKAVLRNPD